METAEIVGIKIDELHALIKELAHLWNKRSDWDDPMMELEVRRYHESESSVFGTSVYTTGYFSTILFVEYQRGSGVAIFEILVLSQQGRVERFERKIRDFLLNLKLDDYEELLINPRRKFICPKCGAQYSTHSLQVNEDGFSE
ncbi:MAG: hypothetical protein RTV41_07485 [Candidatus Thorarchaeota archaeon]